MIPGIVLAAAVVSFVVVRLVERYATRMRLVDRPNARSSHVAPCPRGGGLGIVAGVLVALGLVGAAGPVDVSLLALVVGATLVAAVGFWDDVASTSPGVRLVVQVAAAGVVVAVTGGFGAVPLPAPLDLRLPAALGVAAAIVWMVGVTNFFNFMDGADGLAGGQAVLTFGALAVVLWPTVQAVIALAAVAATAAFLTRNWWPARIFLGDVGSGWIGFFMAALPFTAIGEAREALVLLVAVSLALFLLDPVCTLVRRWRRGARLTESHREHAYQRLFVPGEPHRRVVSLILAGGAVLSALAVLAWYRPGLGWPVVACAALATAVEWRAADRIIASDSEFT